MPVADYLKTLIETAQTLVASGKGILAADESSGTIEKRFTTIQVASTEDNRRAYRELLFTTPGIGEFLSGIILFDETIRQSASNGILFSKLLAQQGILPGIKVDQGPAPLPESPTEQVTKGLDGLANRLKEYKTLGARFAKWRAVITIGLNIPTSVCLEENARRLASYALACQEEGIVPIVEPEVLMDGDHSLRQCEEVTTATLRTVFEELKHEGVALEGMVLKPNMVLAGKDAPEQRSVQAVAEATLRVLKATVPPAVPGVAFLSGGQSGELATARLNAINTIGSVPWQLTFSYSRALQAPVLKAWQGRIENIAAAQRIFYHRLKLNSLARSGAYREDMEREV